MTGSPLYFAYGSNLDPRQMAERCPGHRVVGRAILADHVMRFRGYGRDWKGAVATVEPAGGHDVHGVVFALTPEHYASLDFYEGYDGVGAASNLYDRVPRRVRMEDRAIVDVLTYVIRPLAEGAPSRRYRDAILRGMRHHGLPEDAVLELQSVLTAGDD
ncbi:MAG: gamma-glutamylcyclotransferase family protein [Candidatus Eisenbacteria bacterium]